MTNPLDDDLKRRLNASDVGERDTAFSVNLLGKVRRERRRGILVSFLWIAAMVMLAGLLAAGFYFGVGEAIQLTRGAI